MQTANRVVVDLDKVQYAWRGWVTLDGNHRQIAKPKGPTVRGYAFDTNATVFSLEGQSTVTMLERAIQLKLLDTWQPYVTLQVTANHRLTYTGARAESIWKEWCKRQFNKRKK